MKQKTTPQEVRSTHVLPDNVKSFKEKVRKMQNNTRIGIEIQAINNGYLVTGHKTNGYQGSDTGPTFFATFDELAESLVDQVRKSFDLEFAETAVYGFEMDADDIPYN